VLESKADLQEFFNSHLLADLEAVPEDIRAEVRNNGGGHFNHSLFWSSISPKGDGEPKDGLADANEESIGSHAEFMDAFVLAVMTRFGSG